MSHARRLALAALCLLPCSPLLALEGRVLDPQGKPVAGAVVAAQLPQDKVPAAGANFVETITDPNGAFALATQGQSPFLIASKSGFAPAAVREPAADQPLELHLISGSTVDGVVLGALGKPLEGATVLARAGTLTLRDPNDPDRFAPRAKTNRAGRFQITGLIEDFYAIEATAPGYTKVVRSSVPVTSTATAAINFALQPALTASGEVRDAAGKPVVGAEVAVRPQPRTIRGAATTGSFEIKTDAKGRFLLEHIPVVERYTVRVHDERFADQTLTDQRPGAAGQLGPLTLTLRVGARVAARVLGPDRSPLTGRVKLALRARGDKRPLLERSRLDQQARELTLGEGGALQTEHLSAGKYGVSLSAEGFVTWSQQEIELREGETLDLGEIALDRGATASGTVVDDTQQPVGGAKVRAAVASRAFLPLTEATTDAQGAFQLGGLPAEGELRITATHPAKGVGDAKLASRDEAVQIVLSRPAKIRGRVLAGDPPAPLTLFTASAIVDKPDPESPLPPMLRGENRRAREPISRSGSYLLTVDTAGTYSVRIEAEGFAPARVDGLVVEAGSEIEAPDIVMQPGATLVVRVVEKGTGLAIAGASVAIQAPGFAGLMAASDPSSRMNEPLTGVDGVARLTNLLPGSHTVRVVHGTYAKATVTATIEPQAREVTQQIELGTGGTLEGTVRDPATGAPIRGALVLPQQGMMPDTERGESTNEQGYYRIEHLPAGTHMVIVLPMDGDSDDPQRAQAELVGRMKMQSIEVADGKTAVLDFPAPQQITVSGMIKRGSRAIEGSVMWVRQDGATMVTAQSDPSGSYKVELPKAGNYTVIITPKGQTLEPGTMPGASLAITVPEGESVVSKDLVLQDERWTGVVRDGGSGQPLGGASLMALPIDDRGAIDDRRAGVMRTATTQPDGSFEMDSPTAGRWRVSVAKGGYGTVYLDDLELSEGEVPDEVDVALFPSREMTLRIVNEGGAAIDGAMAFNLSAFSAADFGNVSGQDGQLRLLTLGDGSHNLIVFATGYAPHPLRDLVIDEHSAGSSLEVVLTTGSPVRVKVVDEGREPVKGANLTTLFAPGLGDLGVAFSMGTMMSGRSLATGTDGIVTLIPLEPGEYEVGAAAGDRRGRQSFKVKAREPSEVTLVIR